MRQELASYFIRPLPRLAGEEAYTVFCIAAPLVDEEAQRKAHTWLRELARFPTGAISITAAHPQELDVDHLGTEEADESASLHLSYYDHDIVVMDWDCALLVDEPRHFDEALYIMELLRLISSLPSSRRRLRSHPLQFPRARLSRPPCRAPDRAVAGRGILSELREIRIDMARFSDELSNITKFFGDWHLARIYQGIATRFHLAEWHKSIDEKLKTLDDLYELLNQDRMNRWMLTLEITIVLLFIIDLIMLFFGMRPHLRKLRVTGCVRTADRCRNWYRSQDRDLRARWDTNRRS